MCDSSQYKKFAQLATNPNFHNITHRVVYQCTCDAACAAFKRRYTPSPPPVFPQSGAADSSRHRRPFPGDRSPQLASPSVWQLTPPHTSCIPCVPPTSSRNLTPGPSAHPSLCDRCADVCLCCQTPPSTPPCRRVLPGEPVRATPQTPAWRRAPRCCWRRSIRRLTQAAQISPCRWPAPTRLRRRALP